MPADPFLYIPRPVEMLLTCQVFEPTVDDGFRRGAYLDTFLGWNQRTLSNANIAKRQGTEEAHANDGCYLEGGFPFF